MQIDPAAGCFLLERLAGYGTFCLPTASARGNEGSGLALAERSSCGRGTEPWLPFGALGTSLRLTLEQHIQPEPAPFLINLGVAITYMLARPRWRVSPYVGLWAQGLLQRTPDALGAIPLQRNEGGLVLGGLGGAQVRLWRGGLFTELGYRGTLYRQTLAVVPAWSTVLLVLGYRLNTN